MQLHSLTLILLLAWMASPVAQADQFERKRAPEDTLTTGGGSLAACTVHLIQVPGVPPLQVRNAKEGRIRISWPATPVGFQLVVNTNMIHVTWVACTEPVHDEGTNKVSMVTPTAPVTYFRLEKKP